MDPIAGQFPMLSPYQFASNSPIQNIDLDGKEGYQMVDHQSKMTTIVVDIFYVPSTGENSNGYNSGYNDRQAQRYKNSVMREFGRSKFYDKNHSYNGKNYEVNLQININRLDPKTSRREAIALVNTDRVARVLLERFTPTVKGNANGFVKTLASATTGITRSSGPDDDHNNTHELWHNFTHVHPNASIALAGLIDPNNQNPGHQAAGGIFIYEDEHAGTQREHLNQKNVDDALETLPERFTKTTTTNGTTTMTTLTAQ